MTNELKQFLLKRQKRADAIFDKLIGMDKGKDIRRNDYEIQLYDY